MAETMTAPVLAARRPGFRFSGLSAFYWAMLLIVMVLVVYPMGLLLFNSFVVSSPDGALLLTLDSWRQAWSQPGTVQAIVNTFKVVFTTQLIVLPVGVVITWLMTRTDLPGRNMLDFFLWLAFFLPTLPMLLGWIMLLDPGFGLVNVLFEKLGLGRPFNIYTFWGIVFCHVVGRGTSATYIFLGPAFRNMDSSLEEASRISGTSPFATLRRIVIPVMTPAILVTLIILLIHMFETFEVERVLGPQIKFHVFSTKIYELVNDTQPRFGAAMVLGMSILIFMTPLILLQQYLNSRRSFVTVTSHFKANRLRLGALRWPAFALVFGFCMILTVVPLIFVLVGTCMTLFGFFNIDQVWTTGHWTKIWHDPIFISSVWNTIKLAGGTALIGMLFYALLAYISVRTKFAARGVLDFLTWVPATIPGMILGLGMLWMFLGTTLFRPLYGTIFVLIIALLINGMTAGVQLIKTNMVQLGRELEEASAVAGGSWLYTFRRIIMPILAPVLLSVGTLTFISASRNVANIAVLASNDNRPLALLQLDYMVDGRYEVASVVGMIVVFLTLGVAVIARMLGRQFGIRV
ncbi:MAG: ABC-type Fe3+ transport system permease component [Noviherbaspirillum sp.]|nr:ABC-type Fe3+ transport system permease component [Noviherbaspirillum sp.]